LILKSNIMSPELKPLSVKNKNYLPRPTLMTLEVPVIVVLVVSVAVIVCSPFVCKVAWNVPVPSVNVEFAGKIAAASVPVNCTMPA